MAKIALITVEVMEEETARKILEKRRQDDKTLAIATSNTKLGNFGIIEDYIGRPRPATGLLVVKLKELKED